MSKKNRYNWHNNKPATPPSTETATKTTEPRAPASGLPVELVSGVISPAQLAANRANAQLSTGPRTPAGLANSSKNAVTSALTGRTILLPTDDVEEYASFLGAFRSDLKPVGPSERELVQIIVDCYWRLRRIQSLEFALYAHGHEQFEDAFQNCPEEVRYTKILLQTNLTYEKQFRNYQIQEARLDRKRSKAMAELSALQTERKVQEEEQQSQNGFDFSNAPKSPLALQPTRDAEPSRDLEPSRDCKEAEFLLHNQQAA